MRLIAWVLSNFYLFVLVLCDAKESKTRNVQRFQRFQRRISAPWLVTFTQIFSPTTPKAMCRGSIISQNWILTAAQCFYKVETYNPDIPVSIFAGAGSLYHPDLRYFLGTIEEADIRIHHLYSQSNFIVKAHDIALVKVSEGIKFNGFVKPIKLDRGMPDLSSTREQTLHDVEKPSTNHYTIVAKSPGYLSWSKVTSTQIDNCFDLYDYFVTDKLISDYPSSLKIDYVSYEYFDAEFLSVMQCVQSEREKEQKENPLCQDNLGSPLIKTFNKTVSLVGIMSWGEDCLGEGSPGIYTKISTLLEWIPETRSLFV